VVRRLAWIRAAVLGAWLLATGCTGDTSSGDTAGQEAGPLDARRAAERGELLSLACQACHALTPAGGPDIGPSLYGVFGRPAGSLPQFEYSDALRAAGFTWSPAQLDQWLQAPADFLPGTTMVFAGYGDPQDRRALIDWLQEATSTASE
jgi:cytochrome c2